MEDAKVDRSQLAKTGQEYLNLLLGDADWIVRTPEDLRQLRAEENGPLAKLAEDDFEAFLGGLEFKAGGVGGGSYERLMSSLSLTEIFEVFERFGMSAEYALETHDAKCVGGSCDFAFFSFCPSSVCEHVVKEEDKAAG
jgi:hypothetical protein